MEPITRVVEFVTGVRKGRRTIKTVGLAAERSPAFGNPARSRLSIAEFAFNNSYLRRLCGPRSHEVCLYRFRCASNNCKAGLYRCGLEKRSKLKASVSTTFIVGFVQFSDDAAGIRRDGRSYLGIFARP